MDAYVFINSKDVREYLASQNYQLTPVQRAFLVWQSKRHTLEQKHEACVPWVHPWVQMGASWVRPWVHFRSVGAKWVHP